MNAVALVFLAVSLHSLGIWGRRNAQRLVPAALPSRQRLGQERVLRRGAWACHVAAGVLLLGGGLSLL